MKIEIHIEKLTLEISGDLPATVPDALPPDVRKAADLWNSGATSRDIMAAFNMTGAPDYGTTRISRYRKLYGKELFPYRFHQKQNGSNP